MEVVTLLPLLNRGLLNSQADTENKIIIVLQREKIFSNMIHDTLLSIYVYWQSF